MDRNPEDGCEIQNADYVRTGIMRCQKLVKTVREAPTNNCASVTKQDQVQIMRHKYDVVCAKTNQGLFVASVQKTHLYKVYLVFAICKLEECALLAIDLRNKQTK
jgi:hypothetical protein